MATTNLRFVTKNGLDNNSNSITNLGTAGASLSLSPTKFGVFDIVFNGVII